MEECKPFSSHDELVKLYEHVTSTNHAGPAEIFRLQVLQSIVDQEYKYRVSTSTVGGLG